MIKNIQNKITKLSNLLNELEVALRVESFDYSIHTIQGSDNYIKYFELRDKNNKIIKERRGLKDLEDYCVLCNFNYTIV